MNYPATGDPANGDPANGDRTPSDQALARMRKYVDKYREKSGTSAHTDAYVTEGAVMGPAAHINEFGRPLCPCNFYAANTAHLPATLPCVCAHDSMQRCKYPHCL